MTIVDRYLLVLFFKIFLICLISFTGLFIVVHLFTNLDELVEAAEQNGGSGEHDVRVLRSSDTGCIQSNRRSARFDLRNFFVKHDAATPRDDCH